MRRRRTPAPYFVLAGLFAAGVLTMIAAREGRALRRGYLPAPDVPRLTGAAVTLPDVQSVGGFDWLGDELYLLDPLSHAVTALRRAGGDGWHVTHRFGRRGGGPGELVSPTDVARLRDPVRVAVVDQARLHLFDTAGGYLESVAMDLPCPVMLPRIAAGVRGMFVHGDCMRRSPAGDTIYAVLFWSRDGREFTEVSRDARYTPDGSFGTIFGSRTAFTAGTTHHLFGAGITNCVERIDESERVTAVRRCELQEDAFPFHLSPATRQALESRPRGPAARIPKRFVWYVERFPGPVDLLLRHFHEDSLLVRRLDGADDLAVVTSQHLVGCRTGGCLHAEPLDAGVRLRLLSAAALGSIAAPAAGTGP